VITEAQFQEQVTDLARLMDWSLMHVRLTIGRGKRWTTGTSLPGWPDLALWRPGRFLLAELKTNTGQLTPGQNTVLASLILAGVEVHIWRPCDRPEIEATLTAHRKVPT
jgi:hypothetical protein